MQNSAKQVTHALASVSQISKGVSVSQKAFAVRETWGKQAQDHRVVFFSATPSNETSFDILRM